MLGPALDVVAGYHGVDPLAAADLELIAELPRGAGRRADHPVAVARDARAVNRGYLLRRTPQAIEHFAALRLLTPEDIVGRLRAVLSA